MASVAALAIKKACSIRKENELFLQSMRFDAAMKTGVIDVGGALRGIYAVGALDYCMEQDIQFDLGIGVSAGSANLASYAAHQRGRNHQFYTEYAFRKQYMSLGNYVRKKFYVDMDYVYSTLCNADGENPLDYAALRENPMAFSLHPHR